MLATDQSRAYWFWPIRFSPAAQNRVLMISGVASRCCADGKGVVLAIGVGTVPFVISYLSGVRGHQVVSGILLAFLCLGCLRQGSITKCLAVMSLAFLSHCVAVILLAYLDPSGTADVLAGAANYWQQQYAWIRTGQDPEYEIANWLPAQLQLLGGVLVYGYSSLGALVFCHGFFEVDLMNYYNAQLLHNSIDKVTALEYGWHFWSILRGLGYLFITAEVASLSLQRMTGVQLSCRKDRLVRWGVGLSLLGADCIIKSIMLPGVRDILLSNMKRM
jgi:hypothetical protein